MDDDVRKKELYIHMRNYNSRPPHGGRLNGGSGKEAANDISTHVLLIRERLGRSMIKM